MRTTSSAQLELAGVAAPVGAFQQCDARRVIHRPRIGDGAGEAKTDAGARSLESLLTFAQAAHVLGVSLRQFRRLVDGGKVAFVKVSERAPRVRPSELQRFLDSSVVKYSEVQS